jgi:2-keto-3-deoxy-L-rhamnonate aldolase RhmA
MNAIKDSIKSGRTVVGTTAGPNVDVSILAEAGYDFVLFDTQHSAWEIKQLQPSIQTMRGKQAAPLVRVAANQAYQICFALDAGARGVVVPMVNTRAEAEAAVRACRYHPLGNRSNAGVRGEWGEFKNYRDYLDTVSSQCGQGCATVRACEGPLSRPWPKLSWRALWQRRLLQAS